jgi:translation initiation factor IF-1
VSEGHERQDRVEIRLLVGDRVVVELTPRDLTRGRVVKKL